MKKKMLIFLVMLNFSHYSSIEAQQTIPENLKTLYNLKAYIEGHQFEEYIDIEFFRKQLRLSLTDTSFKIIGFAVSVDNDDEIIEVNVQGNLTNAMTHHALRVAQIDALIHFDRIVVKKGESYFKTQSFYSIVCSKDNVAERNKNKPVCYAYINGNQQKTAKPSIFKQVQTILLSDPTYKIASFTISWKSSESGNTEIFHFVGNQINLSQNEPASVLEELVSGDFIRVENIIVIKNGITNRATDIQLKIL